MLQHCLSVSGRSCIFNATAEMTSAACGSPAEKWNYPVITARCVVWHHASRVHDTRRFSRHVHQPRQTAAVTSAAPDRYNENSIRHRPTSSMCCARFYNRAAMGMAFQSPYPSHTHRNPHWNPHGNPHTHRTRSKYSITCRPTIPGL